MPSSYLLGASDSLYAKKSQVNRVQRRLLHNVLLALTLLEEQD
jgi:hypothetical protein